MTGGSDRHHRLVVLHSPRPLEDRTLLVLGRPGGDNHPASLVREMLSDTAVVPAMALLTNWY